MSSIPTLYTPRLRLRPFSLRDAGRVQEISSDRLIAATTLNIPHPYPDGAAETWIRTHEKAATEGTMFVFAVTLAGTRTPGREHEFAESGHVIGSVSVGLLRESPDVGEIGYTIAVPYWNKGFATEAARAVVDFAFAQRGVTRIFARHFGSNPASGHVMKKLGMTCEGTLRRHVLKWEEYQDVVCYGILREEWAQLGRKKKPGAKAELQTA